VAEEAPVENVKKIRRSPRGILRWLVRFVGLSAVVIAGILILVAVISSIAYLNRARILNQTLAVLVEPFRVSVGEVDFHRLGEVRITDLQLTPKGAPEGSLLASIPETVITYRLGDLRETRRLRTIVLRGADVVIDDTILSSLTAPPPTDLPKDLALENDVAPVPFDLLKLAFFTDSFAIRDSRLTLALEGMPRLEADWHFRTAGLEFDESGLNREAIDLRLSNILIGEAGENGRIARLTASARVRPDLSHIHLSSIHLLRPQLLITPDLLPDAPDPPTEQGQITDPTGLSGAPDLAAPGEKLPLELVIEAIRVNGAGVEMTGFDGADGRAAFPDLSFTTSFAFQHLSSVGGQWKSDAPLSLSLTQLALGEGNAQLLSAGRIDLGLDNLADLIHDRTLSSVHLQGLDVIVSDASLARFRMEKPRSESDPGSPWTLAKLTLDDGTGLVQNLSIGEKAAPYLETGLSATLEQLRIGSEGLQSEAVQSITLEQTKLRAPGAVTAAEPLLAIEQAELIGKWSNFQRDGLVDELVVRGPQIHFTDETLGAWLDTAASPDPGEPRPVNRPVYKVARLDVTGGRLVADSSFAVGRVPKIYSGFTLQSGHADSEDPYSYRLELDDFQVRNHPRLVETTGPPAPLTLFPDALAPLAIGPLNEGDVFSVKEIEVDFTANQIQRTRRIGKVKMSGAVLTVGEGLKSIAEAGEEGGKIAPVEDPAPALLPAPPAPPQAATPPAPAGTPATRLPAWLIEEVEITQSQVQFDALIPQVEGLRFAIETRLTDVPLSLDGLLAEEKLQKIELAGIEIKDPYNSFITVAFLPTIFVEFSLAGLARQEIEKIDLIGPSLHVGQGLFWWIDYQRNFREQNEGASVGIDAGVEAARKPDWVIKTINASAGKIVIAPIGIPIGIVPFPFDATTSMSGGNIELKLTIPDEDHVYRFPDYKVDLYGLTGDVQFNVPVQEIDNNLVQTFALKRAVWKEHEARDLYITVTFDSDGVYGQFGGASYDGYAEGQFNFYLNDPGKWDAWVAGTGMDTGPLTKVLVPDTFLMEGRVSLKVIAEGRDKVVGETTGEFQTTTPGWFDITKLDAVLEKLPPEWNNLKRGLAELSLNALKRFDYDKGAGSLYFQNSAGELNLRFAGDYGSRELNFYLHDQRNTKRKSAASIEVSATPAPRAEATAAPAAPADSQ
jgi:hypothetical protein